MVCYSPKMFPLILFFILFPLKHSLGLQKQLCYNDEECLINAIIDKVYPRFVAGMRGVDSSDPLRLDAIVVDLPTIRYTLNHAALIGLKDCQFRKVNNTRDGIYTFFDYALECEVLTLESEYELNGIIDSVPVEGQGACKIVYNDYYLSITGKHEKVKDEKGKLHVSILNYKVKPVLRGGVKHPEYSNLVFSNNETCESREKLIEKMTRSAVIDVFMAKFIHNLMEFHRHVPIEDMHFKYVN